MGERVPVAGGVGVGGKVGWCLGDVSGGRKVGDEVGVSVFAVGDMGMIAWDLRDHAVFIMSDCIVDLLCSGPCWRIYIMDVR